MALVTPIARAGGRADFHMRTKVTLERLYAQLPSDRRFTFAQAKQPNGYLSD
jgi:hypothetical protein